MIKTAIGALFLIYAVSASASGAEAGSNSLKASPLGSEKAASYADYSLVSSAAGTKVMVADNSQSEAKPVEGGKPSYESAEALAQQLANPVASLISVPVQFNFDRKIGAANDGTRVTMLVQPVIPFRLNDDWNLISRTIVPIVSQKNIFPGAGTQFGLGDTAQSLFLSPSKPGDLVWGVGPVVLLPTGTDNLLSGRKWGAGPSGLLLNQSGPWTAGLLANQVW